MNALISYPEKPRAALLYVLNSLGGKTDFHKLFKILYFADRIHLAKYGRFVFGDIYYAMDKGPVPTALYDYVKYLKNGSEGYNKEYYKIFDKIIQFEKPFHIVALENADLDELSNSDIEAIDKSIEDYGEMDHETLIDVSHDEAWKKAYPMPRSDINFIDMAQVEGASQGIIEHIRQTLSTTKMINEAQKAYNPRPRNTNA